MRAPSRTLLHRENISRVVVRPEHRFAARFVIRLCRRSINALLVVAAGRHTRCRNNAVSSSSRSAIQRPDDNAARRSCALIVLPVANVAGRGTLSFTRSRARVVVKGR